MWNKSLAFQLRLVFDHIQELSLYEKAVLLNLLSRADEKGACFPGKKRIANDTGMSVSQVKRVIKSLEAKGYLVIKRRFKDNSEYSSNLYEIVLSKLNLQQGFSVEANNFMESNNDSRNENVSHDSQAKEVEPVVISDKERVVLVLIDFGLKKEKALKIVNAYPLERVNECVEYVLQKRPHNPAGYFLSALQGHWILSD